MKKFISTRFATNSLLVLFSMFTVFHVLVLVGVLPYTIVWGGKIQSQAQMQTMEAVSLGIMLSMLGVTASYARLLPIQLPAKLFKVIFWAMFALFALNTLGNLASVNDFERLVFTPITLVLAIFSLRLAIEKP